MIKLIKVKKIFILTFFIILVFVNSSFANDVSVSDFPKNWEHHTPAGYDYVIYNCVRYNVLSNGRTNKFIDYKVTYSDKPFFITKSNKYYNYSSDSNVVALKFTECTNDSSKSFDSWNVRTFHVNNSYSPFNSYGIIDSSHKLYYEDGSVFFSKKTILVKAVEDKTGVVLQEAKKMIPYLMGFLVSWMGLKKAWEMALAVLRRA